MSHSESMFVSKQVREWYALNCSCAREPVDDTDWPVPELACVVRMRGGRFPIARPRRFLPIGMAVGPQGDFRRMIRYGNIDEVMDHVDRNPGVIDIGALVAAAETNCVKFRRLFERAAAPPVGVVKVAAENHMSRWGGGADIVAALKLYHAHGFKVRLDQLSPRILYYDAADWLLEHYREAVELAAAEPGLFTCELYHKLAGAGVKLTPTEATLRGSAARADVELQLALVPDLLRSVTYHRGLLSCMWATVWCGTRAVTTAYLARLGFDPIAIEFCAWTIRTPV